MNLIPVFLAEATQKDGSWLEQLSWVATIVLAIAAIIALWQVYAVIFVFHPCTSVAITQFTSRALDPPSTLTPAQTPVPPSQ